MGREDGGGVVAVAGERLGGTGAEEVGEREFGGVSSGVLPFQCTTSAGRKKEGVEGG